jgi:hypothetical protein
VSDLDWPKWNFRQVPPGIKNRNPVQDEFFNSSEALTEISSLVRESIQNSLDAADENSKAPVLIKFSLSEITKLKFANYFKGLEEHVASAIPGVESTFQNDRCRYLIVEDFNTSGLLGDSTKDQLSVEDQPSKNSYHYFVWAEGSSAKMEGSRGRWGIGKIVFPRLSNIKTFFVLSKRQEFDAPCLKDEVLIGMSTLKGHSLGGKNFQPDGWWANYSNRDEVPIPVSNELLAEFKRDWRLKRASENGLSILIPFIPDFITKELVRDCIIRDYFIAIIQGLLEVEISDGNQTYHLNRNNLRRECEHLGEDDRISNAKSRTEMLSLIDMVLEVRDDQDETINFNTSKEFPNKWTSVLLDPDVADRAAFLLDSGKTLHCKVSTLVPSKGGDSSVDEFDLYVRRAQDSRTCAIFSREGIVIPSANPSLIRDHLVLIIVRSGPLANLLADAEGPAHEKWSEKTDKFRRNYPASKGGQVLSFVRKAPTEVLFKIRGSGTEKDSTAFSNFFPLPGIQTIGVLGDTKRRERTGQAPDTEIILNLKRNESFFRVDESPNGFAIKSVSDNPTLIGKRIFINVAYRVRSGDSFAKWEKEDFDLAENRPRLDGCILRDVLGNQMILEITGRRFKAIWGQFDPIRDLDVRADFSENEVIS